jgi:hypothetical protein
MRTAYTPACPSRAELAAFAAGELSVPALDVVAAHLEGCPACLATLPALGSNRDAVEFGLRRPVPGSPFLAEPGCQQAVARFAALVPGEAASPSPPGAGGGPAAVQLGQYQLLEDLGQGGMGTVFRARHTLLHHSSRELGPDGATVGWSVRQASPRPRRHGHGRGRGLVPGRNPAGCGEQRTGPHGAGLAGPHGPTAARTAVAQPTRARRR